MSKYNTTGRMTPPPEKKWEVHPIWRGIGCILFPIVPFMAYIIADLLVKMNLEQGWYPIPAELSRTLRVPFLDFALPHFYINLMVTALLLLIGFALIMVIYTLIYAIAGPGRYGPMDAPPVRRVYKK